jgi:hypothetical protein
MEEIWKPIPNYSLYHASNMGFIKTFNWKNKGTEAIIKPALDNCGYLRTMLKRDDGIFHTVKVHRIIASTFLDNADNKPCVNHINCIKSDNRVINLEWCTISENIKHAYKMNSLSQKGECNACATLTDKQVLEIRQNYTYGKKAKSGITKKEIAEKYNTSFSVIKRIIQGKTWKHIL